MDYGIISLVLLFCRTLFDDYEQVNMPRLIIGQLRWLDSILIPEVCYHCIKINEYIFTSFSFYFSSEKNKVLYSLGSNLLQSPFTAFSFSNILFVYIVPLDIKGNIHLFTKWHTHPLISKGTICHSYSVSIIIMV